MKPIEIKDAQGKGTGVFLRSSDFHMWFKQRQMRRVWKGNGSRRISTLNPNWRRGVNRA